MADQTSLASVRANRLDIYIDDNLAPLSLAVRLPKNPDIHRITSQRFGTNVIGAMEQGSTFEFEIDWQQSARADVERMLDVSGAGVKQFPASVGAQPAEHVIRFHDPAEGATTTGDFVILRAVSLGISTAATGQGPKIFTQKFLAMMVITGDDAGKVWTLGYVAPE